MHLRYNYPVDTVGGACLLTKGYDPSEGVIDTDVYLDSLPMYGRVCISARAVRLMASLLGYDISPAKQRKIERLAAVITEQQAEILRLREAIRNVAEVAGLEALVQGPELANVDELLVEVEAEEAAAEDVDGASVEGGDEPEGGAGASPGGDGDDASGVPADASSPADATWAASPDAAEAQSKRSRKPKGKQ